ncbi:hypothetical protein PGB90_004293 [Kerria lacca]
MNRTNETRRSHNMTRKELRATVEDEETETLKNRKRRTGVISLGSTVKTSRFLSVDGRHDIQFPSVEKLVKKYTLLISQHQQEQQEQHQQNSNNRRRRECCDKLCTNSNVKCETWKTRYFSSQNENCVTEVCDKNVLEVIEPETSDEGCFLPVVSVGGGDPNSPVTSDDGLWFLDVPDCGKRSGSDSAIETLPESDDDKCSNSVSFTKTSSNSHSLVENNFNFTSNNLQPGRFSTQNPLRRRQTWTGPLLNETEELEVTNTDEKISVRKTCSLDQSMRKLNEYQNGFGLRYLYRARRRASTFSNEDFEEDEIQYRCVRTPSVVISDHSDDPNFASSTITLEEIEEFQNFRLNDQLNNAFGDSSSDCSVSSVWSNINNCTTVLDNEYEIIECERKISDCSTCSTLSFDEYDYGRSKVNIF